MIADAQITFLGCADLARSRTFYESVIGLQVVVDQGSCLVFRVANDAYLGVCERKGASPGVATIVTLVTDDVDAWCDRVVGAGGAIRSGPTHNDEYGIYHAFLQDPDGHTLEIQRFDDPDWASAS